MDLIRIYECFCDRTRLRILQLLLKGPLCVCHLQAVLGESQVKVSKHLRYLKARALVDFRREGYWKVYHLPERRSAELDRNLRCLQDCAATEPVFRRDLARLARLDLDCSPLAPRVVRRMSKATCKSC
ncbi:MAG TPA: metalloregulator ArsR/SmtB family transcription factor [Opitutus sp.]|nr:metalloregulator ArsR/SmtB family transcription factor [Opitutus sp.]